MIKLQLSTKVRYAVRAMVELAMRYNSEPIQLNDIACEQDVSVKYLEQLMSPLRTQGIVRTQKGSRGGYHLVRDPEKLTLYDIVKSVEGSIAAVACVDNEKSCQRSDRCVTRTAWVGIKEAMKNELQSHTLAELAREQKRLNNDSTT